MGRAIAASLCAHALVLAAAMPAVGSSARGGAQVPAPEPLDAWAGATLASGLYDVTVGEGAREASPPGAAAAPAAAGTAVQAERGARPSPALSAAPKAPVVREPPRSAAVQRAAGVSPASNAAPRAAPLAAPGQGGAPEAAGGGRPAGSFGAAGAASVRDIGRAFTRAIPPGSDSDRAWAELPTGEAGSVRIGLLIDESGHLTGWLDRSPQRPPRHLLRLVERTAALLGGGTFALRGGEVSEGVQELVLSARVSDGPPPVGEQSGIRLGFEFEAGRGRAWFIQPTGRRVDVEVEVVRAGGAARGRR